MELPGPFGVTAWVVIVIVVAFVGWFLADLGIWPGSLPRHIG